VNAIVEGGYELVHRVAGILRLARNRADSRQDVLDTMVELRQQGALLFLNAFAFGYIDTAASTISFP
jgi:hypothetical protein